MKGSVRLEGFDRLERILERAGERAIEPIHDAMAAGGQTVENAAKRGIAKGPKTGRIYTQRFATGRNGNVFAYGKRVPHQASAEGEYPASDTGTLMRSIRNYLKERTATFIHQVVEAAAKHARPLEFKPPERGGRPFLLRHRPAQGIFRGD